MANVLSRLYDWATDKTNGVKITASRQDAELNQLVAAMNRNVLCSASAPSNPIAGQTWVDTTNKVLKLYRNNEWVVMGAMHVSTTGAVMATPQEGDLWYDTTLNILKSYDGAAWAAVGASDAILRGFELVYKTANDVYVNPGTLLHGSALINKVAATTLTLATAGDWYDGATHTFGGGAGWCYVGIDNAGNVKLLGANPPNKADSAGNTAGTLLYSYIGSTYWRVIGAVWVHTDNTFTKAWYQDGRYVAFDAPVSLTTTISTNTWTDGSTQAKGLCSIGVPNISNRAKFGCYAQGTETESALVGVWLRPNGGTSNTSSANGVFAFAHTSSNQLDDVRIGGEMDCFTDSSQKINYNNLGAQTTEITIKGYYLNIR